jgi:hypothetical protein
MLNFEIMIDFTKYDLEKAKYIARKGGKSVLESMIENVQNLDLVNKAELIKSIKTRVSTSQGIVDKISISYAWYGVFHEIGIAGTQNKFPSGGEFKSKNPSQKMIKQIAENYNVSEDEAFLIARKIIRTGIEKTEWRSKAIKDNLPEIDKEFSDYYAEIILKEVTDFDDIKM